MHIIFETMNYKVIYIIFFLFLATACHDRNKDNELIDVINIEDEKELLCIEWGDTTILSHTKAILLEVTEYSLINEITHLELFNDSIYICDKKENKMLVFDINGKYSHSIGKRGNAPGNFLSVSTFYINPENRTIHLIDPLKSTVHCYNLNGHYLHSRKLAGTLFPHIGDISHLGNGELFVFSHLNWEKETSGFFILSEKDFKVKKKISGYPLEVKEKVEYKMTEHPFCLYGNNIRFVNLFSDYVYSLSNGKSDFAPIYQVKKFGKEIPVNILKHKYENQNISPFKLLYNLSVDGEYSTGLRNIYETTRYIYIEYYGVKLHRQGLLFDKREKTVTQLKEADFSPNFSTISYISNNNLIRVWESNEIGQFKENVSEDVSISDKMKELIERYDVENDNPIILLYQFKE